MHFSESDPRLFEVVNWDNAAHFEAILTRVHQLVHFARTPEPYCGAI